VTLAFFPRTYVEDPVMQLTSPFRFQIQRTSCSCGIMKCGWPKENYELRAVSSFLSFFSGLHGLFWVLRPPMTYRYEHFFALLFSFMFYAVGWWTQFILDADATRIGVNYCTVFNDRARDPLDLVNTMSSDPVTDVQCYNGPFIGTCFMNLFLATNAFFLASILYRSSSRKTPNIARASTLYAIENFGNEGKSENVGETAEIVITNTDEAEPMVTATTPPKVPMVVNVPKFQKGMFEVTASESLLYENESQFGDASEYSVSAVEIKRESARDYPIEIPMTPPRSDGKSGETVVQTAAIE